MYIFFQICICCPAIFWCWVLCIFGLSKFFLLTCFVCFFLLECLIILSSWLMLNNYHSISSCQNISLGKSFIDICSIGFAIFFANYSFQIIFHIYLSIITSIFFFLFLFFLFFGGVLCVAFILNVCTSSFSS